MFEFCQDSSNFDIDNDPRFTQTEPGVYKISSDLANASFSTEGDPGYVEWQGLDMYVVSNDEGSGLYVSTGETPRFAAPTSYTRDHANVELAAITMDSADLAANALDDRITSIKGCVADPFIHILYGHAHQRELAGFGYNSHKKGFVLGLDDVWNFPNEKYLRLGVALGYTTGKTGFFGQAIGLEKSAKHDTYMIEIFGAYETFNAKRLKSNLGITLGYGYSSDKLHRIDRSLNVFHGKMSSNSIFATIEFVKNFYAYKGYNFGLWIRTNYSHITQKGYDESTTAAMGAQHVSGINLDFLTTTLGINVEKEILFNPEDVNKKLTLSMKVGWECRAIQKRSNAKVTFDNKLGIGQFTPVFGVADKNAAIISLTNVWKLNNHWNIVGFYTGRFNKDIRTHNLSCGVEYSF
jgi:hypothetical protein